MISKGLPRSDERRAYDRARYARSAERKRAAAKKYRETHPDYIERCKAKKKEPSYLAKKRMYRERHREQERINRKRWNDENSQRVQVMRRAWNVKNAAKIVAQKKAWRQKNKERIREQSKEWAACNPERIKEQKRLYWIRHLARNRANAKARKKHVAIATPQWSDLDRVAQEYAFANWVTEMTGTPWHVDHVIPLRGKDVCGLHVPENLMVVPAIINLSKNNRRTLNEDYL